MEPEYSENDCIKFKLHVKCKKRSPDAPNILIEQCDEEKYYENANVLSKHLKWIPVGN
jgi:hypothetical protein